MLAYSNWHYMKIYDYFSMHICIHCHDNFAKKEIDIPMFYSFISVSFSQYLNPVQIRQDNSSVKANVKCIMVAIGKKGLQQSQTQPDLHVYGKRGHALLTQKRSRRQL